MAQVQAGMRVLDQAGEEVGTVQMVRMGDPGATTTTGQEATDGLMDPVAAFVGEDEPNVNPPSAARLRRPGFLKVDRPGLLSGDIYVPADEVSAVRGDAVHLSSSRDSLIKES